MHASESKVTFQQTSTKCVPVPAQLSPMYGHCHVAYVNIEATGMSMHAAQQTTNTSKIEKILTPAWGSTRHKRRAFHLERIRKQRRRIQDEGD